MLLPLKVEEITAEWMSDALSVWTPGVRVEAIENTEVIWGTATKVLVDVRYAAGQSHGLPNNLCVKGGFIEDLRAVMGFAYTAEADFFSQIAPRLNASLPKCRFAKAEPERSQGIIILDNLAAQGAKFGDPLNVWSVDQVAAGLEAQAQWHAQTWGGTSEQYPCLAVGSWVRVPAEFLFGEAQWARMFGDPAHAARVPAELQNRERIRSAIYEMWRLDDEQGTPCMIHGDPHIGNTYFDASGAPHFLDWQSGSLAPAMDDVSYFMIGALTVEDRRAHERDLLKHYFAALAGHGGPTLTLDDMWLDYRRHCMHGFVWAVVPPEMQTSERAAAMIERYIAAIVDHDALGALGM
jgi:hypothetical protein